MNKKVLVIGAGMAGLTAAWHLKNNGIETIVIERNNRVGGRVFTESLNGYKIDWGAQFLTSFYRNTFSIIESLGLSNQLIPIEGQAAVAHSGTATGIWIDLRLLLTDLLSWQSKLALPKLFLPILNHWTALNREYPEQSHKLDIDSAAQSVSKVNKELLDYLIQPYLSGIFYWSPETTSSAVLFLLLKYSYGMRIYTMQKGLGSLPEYLARELHVILNTNIINIKPLHDLSYTVNALHENQEIALNIDGIICATPAIEAAKIFEGFPDLPISYLRNVSYTSTPIVAAGTSNTLSQKYYGVFFPRVEAKNLACLAVQSAKHRDHVPQSKDMMVLYPAISENPLLNNLPEDQLARLLLDDLPVAGYSANNVEFTRIHRWSPALPIFNVGSIKALRNFLAQSKMHKRIAFAGDYIGGPFVEGAVNSGLHAAQSLIRNLS